MTPLSIASHGLLDSGPTPALAIAVQGFLSAEAVQATGQRDGDIGWERPGRRFHHVPGRSALEEASLAAVSRTLDKIERRLAKAEDTPASEVFDEVVDTFEAAKAFHPLFDDGALAEFHAALDRIAQTVAKPMFEAPQVIDAMRNALDLAKAYRAITEDEEDATLALLMAA